jgi:hypothetical protein
MKKFVLIFLLAVMLIIPSSTSNSVLASDEPTQVRVVANQTIVYKEPSITSPVLLANCEYGMVFDVISDDSIDYKLFYQIYPDY